MSIDLINHPPHYVRGGIEISTVIAAFELTYNLGTSTAYILRAGKKEGSPLLTDLKKARWHLDDEIKRLENSK